MGGGGGSMGVSLVIKNFFLLISIQLENFQILCLPSKSFYQTQGMQHCTPSLLAKNFVKGNLPFFLITVLIS